MSIGERVYTALYEHLAGGSHRAIAKALGGEVSETTISSWKTGRQIPTTQQIDRVVALSGVSLDWLFTGIKMDPNVRMDESPTCPLCEKNRASQGPGRWYLSDEHKWICMPCIAMAVDLALRFRGSGWKQGKGGE